MKKVSGTLKLDLAQYRELEAFAKFGSDLDKSTQQLLRRGARLVELLKQPQYQPLSVEEQVAMIFAGTKGYLDALELGDVRRFENEYLEYVRMRHQDLLPAIASKKELTSEINDELTKSLDDFSRSFQPTQTLVPA